jgi:hypothetical protein
MYSFRTLQICARVTKTGTAPPPFALFRTSNPQNNGKRRGAMERQGNRIVESTTEARAGETGQNVRYVLAAGTIGVIVLFGAVYFYYFA